MSEFLSNSSAIKQPTEIHSALANLAHVHQIHKNSKVSGRYQFVETGAIVDKLYDLIPEDSRLMLHVPKPGTKTTKHLVEVVLPNEVELFGTKCMPRLLLWNSYLGECSLRIQTGLFRFVCANGLVTGNADFSMVARHLNGDSLAFAMNFLADDLNSTVNDLSSGQFVNRIVEKCEQHVDKNRQLEIIHGLTGVPEMAKLKSTYQIVNGLVREEDAGNRIWDLYNIVNENIRLNTRSQLAAESYNNTLLDQIRAA